jgi:autotransporter-associated beta strand protein
MIEAVSTANFAYYGNTTYAIDLSFYADQIDNVLTTCPFAGSISNPVSTLGSGVSAYLTSSGGFQQLAGSCSIDVDTKNYNFSIDTGVNTVSQTGDITGNGNFTKTGSGNLKLTGSNTYAGNTTISQGILTLDGGNLSNSPLISVASGASFKVLQGTPTVDAINGQGSVSVTGAVLTATSIRVSTLIFGSAGSAATVPEPSSMILAGIFFLGLAAYRFVLK